MTSDYQENEIYSIFETKDYESMYESFKTATKEKEETAFNILNISSYNNHYENFHSDILKAILDPLEKHGQENLFLFNFIDFLNKKWKLNISKENFKNSIVTREQDNRIDILIKDETSKQAIIIENKMNNAPDMDRQIERYYNFLLKKGYTVKGIIYLSLMGDKKSPLFNQEINNLVRNIGAYSNKDNDLVNGWLSPTVNNLNNLHIKSFLHQYSLLIKHQSSIAMENTSLEKCYEFLSSKENIEKLNAIIELRKNLNQYRATIFSSQIHNIEPFVKQHRHEPHYWTFEGLKMEGYLIKIDIWFNHDGCFFVIWVTNQQNVDGRNFLTNFLSTHNLLDFFSGEVSFGDTGYIKRFWIKDYNFSLKQVDTELLDFTNKFFEKLREITHQ